MFPFFNLTLKGNINLNNIKFDVRYLFMFHVEEMTAADFEFAVNLANTLSWGMTVEDFMYSVSLEPNGCFVAFEGSERVGIATTISYGALGWFGNLVVSEGLSDHNAPPDGMLNGIVSREQCATIVRKSRRGLPVQRG